MWLFPTLFLACSGAPEGAGDSSAYLAHLATLDQASRLTDSSRLPTLLALQTQCSELLDETLNGDCGLAVVEALARHTEHPQAALLTSCAALPGSVFQTECAFVVGEMRDSLEGCDAAGPFQADCKMHLLSGRLQTLTEHDQAQLGAGVFDLGRALKFEADDVRPWVAASRWWLGLSSPLDRSRCNALETDATTLDVVAICRKAGTQLYADRLNHARDTRAFPCDGGPLPPSLQTTADPELAALTLYRRDVDLCP